MTTSDAGSHATRPTSTPAVLTGVLAALLHLGIGVFPLSASGLLAPLWALVVIGLGWAAAAAAGWVVWRRWWGAAPLVPLVTVGAWALFITLGEQVLGWTA